MFKVTIKDAQGADVSELRMAGEVINLEPAQVLTFETTSDKISSLVREANSLHLYLGNLYDVEIDNFFDLPNPSLSFLDGSISASELVAKMTLHFLVTHENRGERHIEVLPGSRLQVQGGDQFEFYNTEVSNADLHRKINNLQVEFHLEGAAPTDQNYVNLVGFFDPRIGGEQPPIVIIIDEDHHTTDMFVQPSRKEFEMMGAPTTIALAGVFYAFYFTLKNYDSDSSHVEVIFDGQPLPSWLSLNYLGDGRFALSGVPPLDYEGTANVEINVHAKGRDVNIHTQQAYQLVISAKPELTERAAVGGVLEAEVRGAVATQSSESFMASSQAAASSTAPLAVLAAVSSLTVFGRTYDTQLEQVKFTQFEVDSLLSDDFGLTFTAFVISAGESTITLTATQSDYLSGGDLDDDAREFREDRDDREARDRDDGADVIVTGGAEIVSEITPTILYDDTSANTQGDFETNPANIDVPESEVFTGDAPGLLGPAFLNNEQTPMQEIFSLRGKAQDIGKEVELESGAIVTLNANGSYTYNPNDVWEFLAQGDTAEDSFSYVVNNFFLQATGTVTFIIQGQNDAPIIDDATNNAVFEINENSPVFDIAPILLAADIDQNDVLSWKIVAGSETPLGSSGFQVNSADGEITVADVSQLDFETTPSFTFVVEVADILLATDNTTITINLIDVNENPEIIENQVFIIDEIPQDVIEAGNVPAVTVVGTVDAFDVDAGDSFTYEITSNPFNVFVIDEDTGEITLDNSVVNGGSNPIDFETNTSFTVEVTVTDRAGLTDVENITVDLNDVNDAPIIDPNQSFTINEVPEDQAMAGGNYSDVVGTVQASDVDSNFTYAITSNPFNAFLIDANTGAVTLDSTVVEGASNPIDFETNPSFTVEITITDNGLNGDQQNVKQDVETITINLSDVNDAPIIDANQSFTIGEVPEDQAMAGGNYDPVVGTVQASDVDSDITYAITNNPFNAFLIDANTGAITLNSAVIEGGSNPIDFETMANRTLQLEITVTDNGLNGDQQNVKQDVEFITVNLTEVNDAPILVDNQSFNINEIPEDIVEAGTVPAVTVVGSVIASDVDDGFTYEITDDPLNAFEINANTGEITVNRDTVLGGNNPINFETNPTQVIEVTVTDVRGKSDVTDVTITLSDVNDAPIIELNQLFTIDEVPEDQAMVGGDYDPVVGTVQASDVDSTALTYTITNNPFNAFLIDANTGEITLNSAVIEGGSNPINYEIIANRSLQIEVTVTDNGLNGDAQNIKQDVETITVNLSDVNDAPIIVENQSYTIDEVAEDQAMSGGNYSATVGTVVASDVDAGDDLTYTITNDPSGAFLIDADTGEITLNPSVVEGGSNPINFENNPSFTVQITVTDIDGKADVENVTINLDDINDAPIMDQGQTFDVDENSNNGTSVGTVTASDVDAGDDLSYEFVDTNLTAFAIDPDSGEITVANQSEIDHETTDQYTLQVRVTDSGSKEDIEDVVIDINDVNEAPELDPAFNFNIDENSADGTTVGTVTGTDVDDADQGNLTYSITNDSIPAGAFEIDSSSGEITVLDMSLLDIETTSSFTLEVTVTDLGLLTDTTNVTIDLNDVNEFDPVVNDQSFGLDENVPSGTVVGTVLASDADFTNDSIDLSYSITEGGGFDAFSIDNNTGQLTVNDASEIDFEAHTNGEIVFEVTVSDVGGRSDTANITVNLNDLNEAPIIPAGQTFNVDENSTSGTVGTVSASDPDAGDSVVAYRFSSANTNFAIDNSGVITVLGTANLDAETQSQYTLEVEVDDMSGVMTTEDIVIDINDLNEASPVVNDQALSNLDENLPNGFVVGTVAASDTDLNDATLTYSITEGGGFDAFAINSSTGEITVDDVSDINYEDPILINNSIIFEVTVTDQGGLMDTANITVNLNDLNENPVAPATLDLSVDENTNNNTVVGNIGATDEDAGHQANLSYAITSPGGFNAFDVENNGDITVNRRNQLDIESTLSFTFTVTTTDPGGLTAETVVTVKLDDVNEFDPSIDDTSFPDFDENTANDTKVGTVDASDLDVNDIDNLSYSISSNPADAFAIDSNGIITVDDETLLDFETNPSFTIQIVVTDQGGQTDTANFTVNLNDVNEVPVIDLNGSAPGGDINSSFEGGEAELSQDGYAISDEEAGITTLTVTLTSQPDGIDEGLSLSSGSLPVGFSGAYDSNTGIFEITGSGANAEWLTILQDIRYFNNSVNDFNDRTIEVTASDGVNASDTVTVTMEIGIELQAEDGENQSDVTAPSLTYQDLNAAVTTAYDQWGSVGLGEEQLELLANTEVAIADLEDGVLGATLGDAVFIDHNAANYGWSYGDDLYGQMDLLTVINHEFGHVLGLDEHAEEGLFAETLAPGESYDLASATLDFDQLAHDDHDDHNSLDDWGTEEVLVDDELTFAQLDTQTSYSDDLLPNMADSLQSEGNHVGTHAVNDYASLTIDQQENIV